MKLLYILDEFFQHTTVYELSSIRVKNIIDRKKGEEGAVMRRCIASILKEPLFFHGY